jgi:hypothetical protein
MSLPPDRPTEPLRPQPRQPQPVAYEPVPPPVQTVDVSAVLVRLEDAVNSVRTGLMVVGVIAIAALGVAVYALIKANDTSTDGSAGGVSSARIAKLDDRIDRLSRQVQDVRSQSRSSSGDASGLGDRVAALEKTVRELAARPTPGDATQAVKELSGRIDDLAGDVDQLKRAQAP